MLGENGKLYDSKKGQTLPDGVPPMPLLTDEELKAFPEPTTADVVPDYVARYWDLMALSDRQPAKVIGADGEAARPPGLRGRVPDPQLDPRRRPTRTDRTRC